MRRRSLLIAVTTTVASAVYALPAWNGESREAFLSFVLELTTSVGPELASLAARIAVSENDGVPWIEQPACSSIRAFIGLTVVDPFERADG